MKNFICGREFNNLDIDLLNNLEFVKYPSLLSIDFHTSSPILCKNNTETIFDRFKKA